MEREVAGQIDSAAVKPAVQYGYGLLVEECARRGISKTKAFALVQRGMLDTFRIDGRRFVYIESLETLPKRIAAA